jgi:hypothetical protein
VSSWSWIYWVATALLTGLVLLAWFLVFRAQNAKMAKHMQPDDGQLEQSAMQSLQSSITGFWTSRAASGVWSERAIKADDAPVRRPLGPLERRLTSRSHVTVRGGCTAAGDGGAACGGGCGGGCGN